MKPLAKFVSAALVGAFALFAAPAAQAQGGVNINIGAPAWGPQVPYGTLYYYIPEIDGYYDLYNQQYIVYQDGYWMPLPQLYGYDPYQFHPVIVDYRGAQPWLRVDYYRQRYAYRPYRNYGPGRGYYNGGNGYGYGRPRYNNRGGYSNGHGDGDDRDRDDRRNDNRDHDRDHDDRGGYRGNDNRGNERDNRSQYPGGNTPPRSNQMPQQPQQGGGYNPGQGNHGGQGDGNNGDGRGNGGNRGGGGHGRS